MLPTFRLIFFPVLLASAATCAEQSANVRLYCASLRFSAASTRLLGQTYSLELTTDLPSNPANGELAPFFDPALPSHGSNFRFQEPSFPEPEPGNIAFDVPSQLDEDGDGFPDFFQVRQPVAAVTTQGLFRDEVEEGTVTATWQRQAGSPTGTCRLRWRGDTFGQRPDFTHTYELLEYNGVLVYQPGNGTNDIAGSVQLTLASNPSNILAGPVTLVRVPTNRLNQLTLKAGTLTNSAGQAYHFADDTSIERDEKLKTNYFGSIVFDDGDPETAEAADYRIWVLSIDDPNDANTNGIPDLSDDRSVASTQRALLSLARADSSLVFTIAGVTNETYRLQTADSLTLARWQDQASVTLTNDLQTVELPLPTNQISFWRLAVRL